MLLGDQPPLVMVLFQFISCVCEHLKIACSRVTTVEGSGRLALPQTFVNFNQILDLKLTVVWRNLAWMSKGKFILMNFLPEDTR